MGGCCEEVGEDVGGYVAGAALRGRGEVSWGLGEGLRGGEGYLLGGFWSFYVGGSV